MESGVREPRGGGTVAEVLLSRGATRTSVNLGYLADLSDGTSPLFMASGRQPEVPERARGDGEAAAGAHKADVGQANCNS